MLERIASCIVRSRDHEEALELYEEALNVRKQHGKAADLDTAKIQFGIGIVCCEMGHFNKVRFMHDFNNTPESSHCFESQHDEFTNFFLSILISLSHSPLTFMKKV